MPPKIAFAIVSHSEPEQLLRLVRTLSSMYDSPPIGCHHDFGKCQLDIRRFPSNVKFAHPHLSTQWAHITIPKAILKALSVARESDADWYVVLSGCDYPVRSSMEVLEELHNSPYDAYIDHRLIQYGHMPPSQHAKYGFKAPGYIYLALVRYYYPWLWLPHPAQASFSNVSLRERMRRIVNRHHWRTWLVVKSDAAARLVNRWHQHPPIYAGDLWFTVNRKSADRLLGEGAQKVLRRFRYRFASDETFFHTVLCNEPDLNVCPDSKRYVDWNDCGPHPKWLDESDFDSIVAAKAHFARKFRADRRILDAVDRMLLKRASRVA